MRRHQVSTLKMVIPGAAAVGVVKRGAFWLQEVARGASMVAVAALLHLSPLADITAEAASDTKPEASDGLVIGALQPSGKFAFPAMRAVETGEHRLAQADVSGFIVQPVEGAANQPIPLSIRLPRDIDTSYTFIMVRGLPATFKLSAGFRTKDAWAVSLRDIPGLTLTAPANFQGTLNLEVVLVKGRDVKSESRLMAVSITPDGTIGTASGSQILTAAPRQESLDTLPLKDEDLEDKVGLVPPPSGVPPEEERIMFERANTLLQASDVAAARLVFEHLAMRGSSKAAFAMAQTFDPAFLNTLFVKGLKGDVEQARSWYRKAAEMGNEEARGRLSALGN